MIRRPPKYTLYPCSTLYLSRVGTAVDAQSRARGQAMDTAAAAATGQADGTGLEIERARVVEREGNRRGRRTPRLAGDPACAHLTPVSRVSSSARYRSELIIN